MLVWSGAEVLSRLLATTTRKNHLVAIPSRNTYSQNLLAKIIFDTTENEPSKSLATNWQTWANFATKTRFSIANVSSRKCVFVEKFRPFSATEASPL